MLLTPRFYFCRSRLKGDSIRIFFYYPQINNSSRRMGYRPKPRLQRVLLRASNPGHQSGQRHCTPWLREEDISTRHRTYHTEGGDKVLRYL